MDLKRKKELLQLIDSIGKDIDNDVCGNYMPRVINAVEIGIKHGNSKEVFKKALEGMKNSSFGGKSEKQGYINFVDNIMKKREYNIDSLDFEELMFVCSWLRRIVKTKADPKNKNENKQINNNYRNNNYNRGVNKNTKSMNYNKNNNMVNKNRDEIDEDNPFAKLKNFYK